MLKSKLVLFWEKIEKTADSVKHMRSAKSLQRQAEIDVASASDAYENEQASFEKAKVDAKDKPESGFKAIYESYMKLAVKKKRLEDAITVYELLFEEKPKLL
jgi:DNA polymerase III delta prime subunit